MIPKYRLPVHPGEVLLEEFIMPKKIWFIRTKGEGFAVSH